MYCPPYVPVRLPRGPQLHSTVVVSYLTRFNRVKPSERPCQVKQLWREIGRDSALGQPESLWASCNHSWCLKRELDNAVVVHDCGTVINPLIVAGQIQGGVAQGIGNAFYERLAFDQQGQLINATLADYLLPTALEVPRIEILHHVTPSPYNELGFKGVGKWINRASLSTPRTTGGRCIRTIGPQLQ